MHSHPIRQLTKSGPRSDSAVASRLLSGKGPLALPESEQSGRRKLIFGPVEDENGRKTMKVRSLVASLGVASVVLMGAVGSARAADEWFVLGEQTIKSVDQGVTIKSQGGRWAKDVKQMRIGVEGADVEIRKVVLGWDNRPDDTITDIGVLKAGGKTTPKDAPGRKGRLKSVTVEYKIVSNAPTAVLKVEGYD